MVTCTPFGVNTHRLLVRGIRIPYEEAEKIVEQIEPEDLPMSKWEQEYIKGIFIGLAGVTTVGSVSWLIRRIRKRCRKKEKS